MTNKEKLNMIKEILVARNNGTLDSDAALIAINIAIMPQRPPSKKIIAYAKKLKQLDDIELKNKAK
jgi:hypothetical protein